MAGLSKGETAELISHLQKQGARVEGKAFRSTAGKPSSDLRFPLKVYPPNGGPLFTIHQTVGDVRQRVILDSIIRRAGLEPLGPSRKKEKTMTSTDTAVEAVQAGEPMQHVKVPPAVLKRTYPPLQETVDRIKPYLEDLPETFWTSELVSRLQADDVQGYRGTAGGQHTIEMLDWLGYRVVEAKPNRSGFVYRWVKDPNAVVLPGVKAADRAARAHQAMMATREAKRAGGAVTPIRANGEPVGEVGTNVGTALQDALLRREAEASIALDKGDVQTITIDPVEAQAKGTLDAGERRLHHDRKQCATCNRWYTPEGYERHIEETQHGVEADAVPQGNERIEVSPDGNLRDLLIAGDGRKQTPYTVSLASDTVAKADYDALEAMALENERKLAEAVHGKDEVIAQRDALNARLSEVERERDQWHDAVERTAAEIVQLRAQAAGHRDDGSWLLEDDVLDGDMTLIELAANARRMGVTLEIRVRRA